MNGKPYNQLEISECDKLIRNCVCSQCWGSLMYDLNKESEIKCYKVYCPKCGEDLGFVSRSYIEQKRGESHSEAMEAAKNIGGLLGIKEKEFDRDKTIRMLWPK